jgi:hypothetical protein
MNNPLEILENLELTDDQYQQLLDYRGPCSCHIMPPCSRCSDPITLKEAVDLGFIEAFKMQDIKGVAALWTKDIHISGDKP